MPAHFGFDDHWALRPVFFPQRWKRHCRLRREALGNPGLGHSFPWLDHQYSQRSRTNYPIEWHVTALKELLKEPSNRDLIKPIFLDFDDVQDVSDEEVEVNKKEKAKIGDEDLRHRMTENAKIYDGMGDLEDHVGRFIGMGNQGEWPMPACDKDLTEISKIVRRANETLPNFKERRVSESNAIPNVQKLMQISSFISSHKCLELSKHFLDSIPKTVNDMLKKVDDYLQSEEAFRNTELPKREFQRKDAPMQWGQRND
ncbi:hypothetical protein Tco_0392591 [Tanacetum coccineum]